MLLEIFLINLSVIVIAISITFLREKKTPWIIIVIILALIVADLVWSIYKQDMLIDKHNIEFMESKNNFSGEEVDRLWHWRHGIDQAFGPSKRFCEIYDQKIKPLPGARY